MRAPSRAPGQGDPRPRTSGGPGRDRLVKRTVGVVVPVGAQRPHDQGPFLGGQAERLGRRTGRKKGGIGRLRARAFPVLKPAFLSSGPRATSGAATGLAQAQDRGPGPELAGEGPGAE